MPNDRYNFDKQVDIDSGEEKLNTHNAYEDIVLSTKSDEKITARREARKARYAKNSDVKVISPEDINRGRKLEKKRIRAGKAVLIAVIFVGVLAFVCYSGIKLTSLELEKKEAEKELARLNQKVEQLETELKELDSDEYVENAARSELHMIKEGEVMYIVDPSEEAEDEDDVK